jgi:hypothetical protein
MGEDVKAHQTPAQSYEKPRTRLDLIALSDQIPLRRPDWEKNISELKPNSRVVLVYVKNDKNKIIKRFPSLDIDSKYI